MYSPEDPLAAKRPSRVPCRINCVCGSTYDVLVKLHTATGLLSDEAGTLLLPPAYEFNDNGDTGEFKALEARYL